MSWNLVGNNKLKVVRIVNRYRYWRNKYFTTLRSRVHVYLQIIKIKMLLKKSPRSTCIWTFELFVLIIYNWIVSTVLPILNMEKKIPLIPWSGLVSFHVAEEYARHVFIHFFFISSCWGSRYGPPVRTQYRVTVENMSSRTSWQVISRLLYNRA